MAVVDIINDLVSATENGNIKWTCENIGESYANRIYSLTYNTAPWGATYLLKVGVDYIRLQDHTGDSLSPDYTNQTNIDILRTAIQAKATSARATAIAAIAAKSASLATSTTTT